MSQRLLQRGGSPPGWRRYRQHIGQAIAYSFQPTQVGFVAPQRL